jgi:hypothetical protein
MNFVIVEPHSDDAFLSVGWHIEQWVQAGHNVHIITLYPVNHHSLKDAAAYASAVGASWEGCHMKAGPMPKERLILPEGQLILPLGGAPLDQTEHTQDHWNVRRWLEEEGCWYFLDQPYAIVQKHSVRFSKMLHGMTVVSYCKPPKSKWRHIPLFKGQQKFFYFNNVDKLKQTCELLVTGFNQPRRFPR